MMTYERPDVRILSTLHGFWRRCLSMQLEAPAGTDWRARKITNFIDTHLGKVDWDLDDLCRQLGLAMSGRQARRVFRRAMRIGFKEYLKKSRLITAAEQLRASDTPIKAIAVELGYAHARNLARSFKRVFLVSPIEFRAVSRERKLVA